MKSIKYKVLLIICLSFQILNAEYTWEKINDISRSTVLGYKTDYTLDSIGNIYYNIDSILYKSTDDGKSWHKIFRNGNVPITSLSATKDNLILFSLNSLFTSHSDSIFYSKDLGETFETLHFYEPYSRDSTHYNYIIFTKKDTIVVFQKIGMDNSHKFFNNIFYSVNIDSGWKQNNHTEEEDLLNQSVSLFFIDSYGIIYFPIYFKILSLESLNSKFKRMDGIDTIDDGDQWGSPNLFQDDKNNLFITTHKKLFQLNYQKNIWERVEMNISPFWNIYFFEGRYFFFDGKNIVTSDDNFHTYKNIHPATISLIAPEFFLTLLGTIIFQDTQGVIWRGVENTNVKENNESNNFSLSPNPATDFLEISVAANGIRPEQTIEIFSVLGIRLLSTPVNLTPTLSMLGEGVRIDVSSLPQGIYFVKVGAQVGKFVKI